jgi:hypothetical protein
VLPYRMALLRLPYTFKYVLLAIFVFIVPTYQQFLPVYSVNSASTTYWSASAGAPSTKVTSLASVPTLVYNCHITPALCANVESAGRAGAGAGNYPAPGFESFGWDPDQRRKDQRRSTNCPSSWRKGHLCPEPNQPAIHPVGATNGQNYRVDPITGGIQIADANRNEPFLHRGKQTTNSNCREPEVRGFDVHM